MAKKAVVVCGGLGATLWEPRKYGCGGHLWLQGRCMAVGMGCMHVWLECAALAGVPLALLGSRGDGRPHAMGTMHLRGSWGSALDGDWSQPPAWRPQRNRPIHDERAEPPESASVASKFISTKSAPGRRPEPAQGARWCCGKTVLNFSLSSRMVHQHASTRRDPLPDGPQKLLGLLQQAADTRVPGVPRRHGDARRAREVE